MFDSDAQTKPQKNQRFLLNNEARAEQKDLIPELKKKIIKFFNSYASTLTELKAAEKITIILDLNRTTINVINIKEVPSNSLG